MRRIHVVFAALAIVVTSFAAFAGSAVADDLNCRDARGDLIRCDGDLYEPYYNTSGYNDYPPFYYDYNDNYYPPFYSPFYSDYSYADYEDYDDFVDEYEDAVDDYLDGLEDSSWGYYSYNW
jgi:hypothetical protein